MEQQIIGNTSIKGYVTSVDGNRFGVKTGSFTRRNGEKAYKAIVSVFIGDNYDGFRPANDDYVEISGDLTVGPRKNDPSKLSLTMNANVKYAIKKVEAPKAKEKPAGDAAPAQGEEHPTGEPDYSDC